MLDRKGRMYCPDSVFFPQMGIEVPVRQHGDPSDLFADVRDQIGNPVRHMERWLILAHECCASPE